MVTLGIDALIRSKLPWEKGEKVGLLCNQASVNGALLHIQTGVAQKDWQRLYLSLFSTAWFLR